LDIKHHPNIGLSPLVGTAVRKYVGSIKRGGGKFFVIFGGLGM